MATLNLSIEIADTATPGHFLETLKEKHGAANGAILARIIQENSATYPRFEIDSELLIGQVMGAAVTAAEV